MLIEEIVTNYFGTKGKEVTINLSALPKTRGDFSREFEEMYRAVEYTRGANTLPFEMSLISDVKSQIYNAIPRHSMDLADALGIDPKMLTYSRGMQDVYNFRGTSESRMDKTVTTLISKIHILVNRFVQHYIWKYMAEQMQQTYAKTRKNRGPHEAFGKSVEPLALLAVAAKDRKIQFHPIYRDFMDYLESLTTERRTTH